MNATPYRPDTTQAAKAVGARHSAFAVDLGRGYIQGRYSPLQPPLGNPAGAEGRYTDTGGAGELARTGFFSP